MDCNVNICWFFVRLCAMAKAVANAVNAIATKIWSTKVQHVKIALLVFTIYVSYVDKIYW